MDAKTQGLCGKSPEIPRIDSPAAQSGELQAFDAGSSRGVTLPCVLIWQIVARYRASPIISEPSH
jgi:hypothetical protein